MLYEKMIDGSIQKKMKESSLAKAIADAHKKSVAENTIQAYTEVIRQCQRETSQLQTVPFMRSDSHIATVTDGVIT
jgi:hypothetical protein